MITQPSLPGPSLLSQYAIHTHSPTLPTSAPGCVAHSPAPRQVSFKSQGLPRLLTFSSLLSRKPLASQSCLWHVMTISDYFRDCVMSIWKDLILYGCFFKALHVHNTVQKVGPNSVTGGEASNLFPTKETLSFYHLWLILKLQTVLGTPQIPPPPESVHKVINLIPSSEPLLVGLPCACFEARRICFQKTKKKVGQE